MIIFLHPSFSKFSQFYMFSSSVVRFFERKIVKTTLKNRFDLVAKKPAPSRCLHTSQKSLKIWSTKSAKKRHLCASISAHGVHSQVTKIEAS